MDRSISARICARRDTTANWSAKLSFIPLVGEIIIYTDRYVTTNDSGEDVYVPGIKIGDGLAYCVDLPFVDSAQTEAIMQTISSHIEDPAIHTSAEEKEKWDQKVTCDVSGETLLFTSS